GGGLLFFFFSSRRRHTRSYGDWSSDVCSSDLRLARRDAVLELMEGSSRRAAGVVGRCPRRPPCAGPRAQPCVASPGLAARRNPQDRKSVVKRKSGERGGGRATRGNSIRRTYAE